MDVARAEWTERELPVSLGRVATATLGGDWAYVVRHRDLASFRVTGDELAPWHPPVDGTERTKLDERYLHVAADARGVFFVLLADGSTWRREPGKDLEPLTTPDQRIAGHYAHRVGFVYDALGDRLVIVGGDQRNDGFALDLSTRTLAPLPYGPAHGVGQTVATPHGVYRLVDDALWLLQGDAWSLVLRHEHARRDHGDLLFWSPRDDALFFVSEGLPPREPPICVELTSDGANPPLVLPGSFEAALEAHGHVAQVDPQSARLFRTDRLGIHRVDLSALQLEGGPPVAPLAYRRDVVRSPPSHWYREALALRQRELESPPLDLPVRDGWVLAATLPSSPHLPLADAGSLVLFSREVPYDHEPWTLSFTNAFEARIVDEVYPMTAGGMLLDARPYREVEPVFATRVDTAHDGSPHLARGSKIGGFPALVTGTREDAANAFVADVRCEDCEAKLRFVVQLAWPEWDLISAVIYVYACPFGHSAAAVAQNV
ncbi:MAG TPA: hypothetical protein RMH99_01230 [Sandaracinaceae bacterium LLY-WYZ-13_1]|nr:hypothetical protein [Sandaracinaceae bacterium LLY-WYZ-13_1]